VIYDCFSNLGAAAPFADNSPDEQRCHSPVETGAVALARSHLLNTAIAAKIYAPDSRQPAGSCPAGFLSVAR
jgi:hypothetical protein